VPVSKSTLVVTSDGILWYLFVYELPISNLILVVCEEA
jgi:hypothetical protein